MVLVLAFLTKPFCDTSGSITNFNLILWNVEGLSNLYKQIEDNVIFDCKRNAFLCFVETMTRVPLEIPNYYGIHSLATSQPEGQKGRPKGGVSVYVSKEIGLVLSSVIKTDYVIVRCKFVTVICFYLNPDHKQDELDEKVTDALNQCEVNENVILVGDFNARSDNNKKDHKFEQLITVAKTKSLSVCNNVNIPTFSCKQGKSTVSSYFL